MASGVASAWFVVSAERRDARRYTPIHSALASDLSRRAVAPGRAALVAACRSAVEWVIADHLLAVQVEEVLRGRAPRHVGEGRALTTQHCAAQLLQGHMSIDPANGHSLPLKH